ncbi:hypothetical protein EZS27_016177 [termite gut metagenome]|uniref:Uncharacterized protein n=1 Tax=termite gut metagenome TaxID=433724 RepID=A0A5J4RR50_9ZZZZ
MRQFQIDYKVLILLLLPTFLRKWVIVAWLLSLCRPVMTLYNLFMTNRDNNLYKLQITGQVCYLRKLLNDAFPDAQGAIRIADNQKTGVWQYSYDEDVPDKCLLIEDAGTLFYDKYTISKDVEFIVMVPATLHTVNNEAKIRSLLNNYKLLSKSYLIQYYE